MKRFAAIVLSICLLVFMGGCAKKGDKVIEKETTPSVQVAYAAYQYENGYQLSEGWMYDMTLEAGGQLDALEKLVSSLKMTIRDELFGYGRGYRLTFMDAEGNVTREMLVLENGTVSAEGMVYDAAGVDALLEWLHALKIEEQDVE